MADGKETKHPGADHPKAREAGGELAKGQARRLGTLPASSRSASRPTTS